MININNKSWDDLRFSDINKFLKRLIEEKDEQKENDENFFFEFKADNTSPKKLIKEISAFANTYGGYIFLGVEDDKTISGCTAWNEQRIHISIHNAITPIPNFDVRKFTSKGKRIYVIRIDEGRMPPYITNTGLIYERVSSGSFPIKESSKLMQLYQKRKDQLVHTKNKIELPPLKKDINFPANVFGYLDFGFSLACSNQPKIQTSFNKAVLEEVAQYLRMMTSSFSISYVGYSYLFGFGDVASTDQRGKSYPIDAGLHDFLEIMPDGSIRSRIILTGSKEDSTVDITMISFLLHEIYKKTYEMVVDEDLSKIFSSALKYENLTVLRQFVPVFQTAPNGSGGDQARFANSLLAHEKKYGGNLIIEGSRVPKNDYNLIDKKYFSDYNIKYNRENLLAELFYTAHFGLGYFEI